MGTPAAEEAEVEAVPEPRVKLEDAIMLKNEGARMDKKQKHKKPKKGPKSAPQKRDDEEDNKMEKDDTEQNQNLLKQVNINSNINQDSEGKKSYSSVIKSSLQSSAASEHKKEPLASSKS